jgi:hypothetical protein
MWPVRALLRLKSRTRHGGAPPTQKFLVTRGGTQEEVELPLADAPMLLAFLLFEPPAHLGAGAYASGITMNGVVIISFGPNPEAVAKRLGASQISITNDRYRPAEFARMIGKIAYAWAVAEGKVGLGGAPPHIVAPILGLEERIGLWVGNIDREPKKHPGLLHRLAIKEGGAPGLVTVEVQLFANSDTPT